MTLPASKSLHQRVVHGEIAGMVDSPTPQHSSSTNVTTAGSSNFNTLSGGTQQRQRQRRQRRPRNHHHHRKSLQTTKLDGLTTATSLSSTSESESSPSSPASSPPSRSRSLSENEADGADNPGDPLLFPPQCVRPLAAVPNNNSFKYADSAEITNATLRKGCLIPEQGQGQGQGEAPPLPTKVKIGRGMSVSEYANNRNSEAIAASSIDPFANIPYATLSRKSADNAAEKRKSNSSMLNCFDPLTQRHLAAAATAGDGCVGSNNNGVFLGQDGQVAFLPPSDSIPDILQTLNAQQQLTDPSSAFRANGSQSLTRTGHIPREVMALYAKVDLKKDPRPTKGTLIVNELSNLWPGGQSEVEEKVTGSEKRLLGGSKARRDEEGRDCYPVGGNGDQSNV